MLPLIMTLIQAPAALPPGTPFGGETVIPAVGLDGLPEWRPDPDRPAIAHVRDRRGRWYRIVFTGPCRGLRANDSFGYTTAPGGNFDRFSRVRVGSAPQVICRVRSIRRSTAPTDDG